MSTPNVVIALDTALSLRRGTKNDRVSPAPPSTNPVSSYTAARSLVASVNGGRQVTQQAASVSYLSTSRKLVIPAGLLYPTEEGNAAPTMQARKVINSINYVAGQTSIAAADRFPTVSPGTDAQRDAAPTEFGMWGSAADGPVAPIPVTVTHQVGTLQSDGSIVPRVNDAEEAEIIVKVSWKNGDVHDVLLIDLLPALEPAPTSLLQAMSRSNIRTQLSDLVCPSVSLNYSVIDSLKLQERAMRWRDAMCHTQQDASRYSVQLTPYTVMSMAALNFDAVAQIPHAALARSYMVALGMLPSDDSLHNAEYHVSSHMPDEAQFVACVEAHGAGEDGEEVLRFSVSLCAAFGITHLANNHTYKENDDVLKRKSMVAMHTLRTVLPDALVPQILVPGNLETLMRTTMHPFGLSGPYRIHLDGQIYRFLAEPLQIRSETVPAELAKLGLVSAVMGKMVSLPVGALFTRAYGDKMADMQNLKVEVLAQSAAYSPLHKHYGYSAQLTLSSQQEAMLEGLMPVVAAYALVFEVSESGSPIGAQLSQAVRRTRETQSGLTDMYVRAFESYRESGITLKALVGGADEDKMDTS